MKAFSLCVNKMHQGGSVTNYSNLLHVLYAQFAFFPLMGLPNLAATSQVNTPVSAVRADYDSTVAAACVHLALSNVLCNLTGSLCQLRSSLHHPVSHGALSRALYSSCVRVGFWLEPHSWISEKTAAYRQRGLEGMALSS